MPADVAAIQPQLVALPAPIFVLATRPAGTALAGAMIGRNPAAFELPQLNLFVSDTLEGMGRTLLDPVQNHGLLRALAYLYGSEQTIISIGMARRWVFRRLSWSTIQVFDELRGRVAPRRLVDKSAIYTQNTKCLERIRRAFPDAYYVHVVEHPLAGGEVNVSVERDGGLVAGDRDAEGENPAGNQLRWLNGQRLISEAMNHVAPERLTVLKIESLLTNPRAELSNLCARLELQHDEAAIAEMLHPEHSPFASFGPVGANLGDDPAFLRDPTFPPKSEPVSARQNGKPMLAEVAQFAARYGYE